MVVPVHRNDTLDAVSIERLDKSVREQGAARIATYAAAGW
jgi:hypothetical protein